MVTPVTWVIRDCALLRSNECRRVQTMIEPTTRVPRWLTIDLTVIVISVIIIGVGLWIGLP
jgi:hypothetical protein